PVPERDLTVVAREHVETEQRDRVDEHLRELEEPEPTEDERQHHRHRDHDGAGDHERPPVTHTRRTTARPKRPLGLTTSTMMMIASATVSFSSVPMKCT